MKVREIGEKGVASVADLGKGRPSQSAPKAAFIEQLKRIEGKQTRQELEDMLADIDEQGKKLAERHSAEDLQAYKSKVKEFLGAAVKNIYKLKEDMGFDRRGRHKIYTSVEKVDKELDDLTKMFMDRQQDKLAIAAKVDEIRGMLVDIYM